MEARSFPEQQDHFFGTLIYVVSFSLFLILTIFFSLLSNQDFLFPFLRAWLVGPTAEVVSACLSRGTFSTFLREENRGFEKKACLQKLS